LFILLNAPQPRRQSNKNLSYKTDFQDLAQPFPKEKKLR